MQSKLISLIYQFAKAQSQIFTEMYAMDSSISDQEISQWKFKNMVSSVEQSSCKLLESSSTTYPIIGGFQSLGQDDDSQESELSRSFSYPDHKFNQVKIEGTLFLIDKWKTINANEVRLIFNLIFNASLQPTTETAGQLCGETSQMDYVINFSQEFSIMVITSFSVKFHGQNINQDNFWGLREQEIQKFQPEYVIICSKNRLQISLSCQDSSSNSISCPLICHSSCKTCQGGSTDDKCTSCKETNQVPEITNSPSLCQCSNTAQYLDSNYKCQNCHVSCSQCTGSALSDCLTCQNTGTTLMKPANSKVGSCKCTNSSDFLDISDYTCKPCHITCLTCDGGLLTNCLTCRISQDFVYDESSKSCKCTAGQTFDSISNKCVISCQLPCKTCLTNTTTDCQTCLEGDQNLMINSIAHKCECIDGFYMEITNFECKPCDVTCATCSGPSPSDCKTCDSAAQNFEIGIVSSNGNTFTCVCNSNYRFDSIQQKCQIICSDGFFYDLTLQKCQKCYSTCEKCTGPLKANCLSCSTLFHFRKFNSQTQSCDCLNQFHFPSLNQDQDPICTLTCQNDSGFYTDLATRTCVPCHQTCLTCFGIEQNQCSACNQTQNRSYDQDTQNCLCQFGYQSTPVNSDQNSTVLYSSNQNNDPFICTVIPDPPGAEQLQTAVTTASIGVAMTSVPLIIFGNPVVLLQLLDVLQIVRFILYIQVDYPPLVEAFFQMFQNFDFGFIPNLIPDDEFLMESDKNFYKHGVDSLFLRNSQDYLVSFICGLLVYFFMKMLQNCVRSKDTNNSRLKRVVNVIIDSYQWGFFLGLVEAAYMNISVFSLLQIINSACDDVVQIISYSVAFIFFIAMISFPYYIINLAIQLQEKHDDQEFIKQYGILFDFFVRQSAIQSGFFSIVMLRKIMFAVALVIFQSQPGLVLTILSGLNLVIIRSIFVIKPYKDRHAVYRDVVCESSFFLIHLFSFPFLFQNSISEEMYDSMSYPIVILTCIIVLAQLLFIIQEQIQMIKDLWEALKERRQNRLKFLNQKKIQQKVSINKQSGENDESDHMSIIKNSVFQFELDQQ